MDECCRGRHLWTTLAEHLFDDARHFARHAGRCGRIGPCPPPKATTGRSTSAAAPPGRPPSRGWSPCGTTSAAGCAATCWPGSPSRPTSSPRSWPTPRSPGCPRPPGCSAVVGPTLAYAVLGSSPPAVGRPGVDDRADDGHGARRRRRRAARRATPPGGRPRRRHRRCSASLGWAVRPRLPRRPALQAGARRLPRRRRRAHGRQPARQPHRHRGRRASRCPPSSWSAAAATSTTSTCRRSCSPRRCSCCSSSAAHFFPRLPNPLIAVLLGAAAVAVLGLAGRSGSRRSARVPGPSRGLRLPDLSLGAVAAMLGARARHRRGRRTPTTCSPPAPSPSASASGSTPTRSSSPSAPRTSPAGCCSGLPGEQQRQPHRDRRLDGQPHPAVLAGHPGDRPRSRWSPSAPVIAAFPSAALGALVVYAAIRLVDVAEIRRVAAVPPQRARPAASRRRSGSSCSACSTASCSPSPCRSVDLLRRVARPHDGILGYVRGLAGMHDVDDFPEAEQVPGLVVYRYDSPLFFANAEDFHHRALAAVDEAAATRWSGSLINAEANVEVDLTSLDALDPPAPRAGRRAAWCSPSRGSSRTSSTTCGAAGLVDAIGTDRIYATLPTAVAAYLEWHEEQHGVRTPSARGHLRRHARPRRSRLRGRDAPHRGDVPGVGAAAAADDAQRRAAAPRARPGRRPSAAGSPSSSSSAASSSAWLSAEALTRVPPIRSSQGPASASGRGTWEGCAQLTTNQSGGATSSTPSTAARSVVPSGSRPSVSTVNPTDTGSPPRRRPGPHRSPRRPWSGSAR